MLLKILAPCVISHYYSRCGHLMERNSTLTNFIPIVLTTGKNNYQHALFKDMVEKVTIPKKAHEELHDNGGTICSTSGLPGSN